MQHGKLAAYIAGIAAAQALVFCAARGAAVLRARWAARAGRGPQTSWNKQVDGEGGCEEVCMELEGGWSAIAAPRGAEGKDALVGKGKESVETV